VAAIMVLSLKHSDSEELLFACSSVPGFFAIHESKSELLLITRAE